MGWSLSKYVFSLAGSVNVQSLSWRGCTTLMTCLGSSERTMNTSTNIFFIINLRNTPCLAHRTCDH